MLITHSITNAHDLNLQLESTLQELPLWEVQVELYLPGHKLTSLFEKEPLLPGIILTKSQECVSVISRRKFFEHMSRPYSFGLFSMRPIENLYNFLQPEVFVLSEHTTIVEATQLALQRSPQLAYEPILVEGRNGKYGLIDFHQLLLAYSQIHALTLNQLQQVEEQSRMAKAGFRDLKQNYGRLLQNEKMAALGQLVAGIAHEINNPVNFIAGNLTHAIDYSQTLLELISLYQQYYPNPVAEIQSIIDQVELDFLAADLPSLLNSMNIGCDRIGKIIHSLRNFSRLDESERKMVDIHEGIDSTLLILQSRLKNYKNGATISVIKEYGNIPLVECYAGLLNQVFMNILANAIDALWDSTQKSPTIRIHTELTNEQQIMICIGDNGPGIPEDAKNQLFDPFFTTKPVGKGTGLGLSISHQIVVEKHEGQMYCLSTLGEGAEFIIKIPIITNS